LAVTNGGSGSVPFPAVGFIGVGNIGRPMCLSIAKRGFPVVAYDPSPEVRKGLEGTEVEVAGSLVEVARVAEVFVLSLPNSDVVEKVVLEEGGLLEELSEGDTVIDTSSSRPSSTREIARRLAGKNIEMLDAPVSGGVPRAEKGSLAVMVGGNPEVFEKRRAVVEAFSGEIFYLGASGSGHMAKALNNLLSATTLASAAEAVLLGERAGLDPEKLVEVINASSGRSGSTEIKFPRYVLNRAFDDGFAISLMSKDVKIALDTASELGFPAVMGSVVGQMWQAAVAQGFGGEGHTAIYKFLEAFTGDRSESE
jgi:3-hydroxyisobutyrate dehydrogenase